MVNMVSARNSVRGIIDDYGSPVTLHPVDITTDKWGDKTEYADERAIVHFKMNDDTTSTTVTDSSGRGNTGTASQNTDQFKSIVGHYAMDEDTTTTAVADTSGKGNNGVTNVNTDQMKSIANWLKLDGDITDSSDKGNDGAFNNEVVIDNCDALTGWSGDYNSLNTTTFAEGTGAINLWSTDEDWVVLDKTISTLDLENKSINLYVYFKDQATINKLGTTHIEFNLGTDSSNRYKYYKDIVDLEVGWNTFNCDTQNPGDTIGSPDITDVTWMRFSYHLDTGESTVAGDVIFDEISTGKPLKCKNQAGTDLSAYQFDVEDIEQKIYEPSTWDTYEVGPHTMSVWCKPNSTLTNQYVMCKYNWRFRISSQKFVATIGRMNDAEGDTYDTVADNTYDVNEWYLLTMVYDPANQEFKFYVNGAQQGTTTDIGTDIIFADYGSTSDTYSLQLGNSHHGTAVPFQGSIADSRIYARALTDAEILELYNSGNPLPTNPADDGKLDGALYFSGNGDYITSTPGIDVASDNLTVAGWFKFNSATQDNIWRFNTAADGDTIRLNMEATTGKIFLWNVDSEGAGTLVFKPATNYADNAWHHITVTKSGQDYVLTIDGNETSGTGVTTSVSTYFRVGHTSGDFDGYCDDLRIYNRALTAAEISEIYNSGTGITTNPADDGIVNEALYFDGLNGSVTIPHSSELSPTDELSLASWVKPISNNGTISQIIGKRDYDYYQMRLGLEWQLQFSTRHVKDAVYDYDDFNISETIPQSEWSHIVCVYSSSGNYKKIYKNGVLIDTRTTVDNDGTSNFSEWLLAPNTYDVSIGIYPAAGDRLSNMYIDDTRVFDYALTQAEIDELYNSGSGTEDPLSTNTTTTVGIPYDIMGDKFNFQTPGDLSEGDLILIVKDTEDVFVDDSERKFYITYKNVDYDVTSFEKFIVNNITIAKQLILNKRQ